MGPKGARYGPTKGIGVKSCIVNALTLRHGDASSPANQCISRRHCIDRARLSLWHLGVLEQPGIQEKVTRAAIGAAAYGVGVGVGCRGRMRDCHSGWRSSTSFKLHPHGPYGEDVVVDSFSCCCRPVVGRTRGPFCVVVGTHLADIELRRSSSLGAVLAGSSRCARGLLDQQKGKSTIMAVPVLHHGVDATIRTHVSASDDWISRMSKTGVREPFHPPMGQEGEDLVY